MLALVVLKTGPGLSISYEKIDVNFIDALSRGAVEGMKLAINVAAMLIAIIAAVVVATYGLCGFANFGSSGIMIAGVGGIAPGRKHDLARLGIKSIISGSLAAFMTGTIAGLFL